MAVFDLRAKGGTAGSRRATMAGLCAVLAATGPARALSELQEGPAQKPEQAEESIERAPLPAPDVRSASPEATGTGPDGDARTPAPPTRNALRPNLEAGDETPEIVYDLEALPDPVRRMHRLIVEACKSGDLERLRPLLSVDAEGTRLSFGGVEGDPIAFLREVSGDEDGQEILAILLEVLQAGYVHLDAGTPAEMYVWPYFFALPLDSLDQRQRVELFTLVTAGDYQDMKVFGAYIFYRVGITPEGRWSFFIAGD